MGDLGGLPGESSGGNGRSPRGWTAVGAVAVMGILFLSSMASAATPSGLHLSGTTPNNTIYANTFGCASINRPISTLNSQTGIGRFAVSTKAASCPRSDHTNSSETWVLSGLGDLIPVRMRSSSSGVSIGFSITANLSDLAVVRGSTTHCPLVWQNQTSYNGTTWFNQTFGIANCEVLANVYVTASASLEDMTTGAYYYPTTFGNTSWSNESGYSASFETFGWTYSNPLYWGSNFSYPGSWTNYSLGTGGMSSISVSTTLYFNGSFSGMDRYVLGFYFTNEVFSEQAYFLGTAHANLNAAKRTTHEDITSVSVY